MNKKTVGKVFSDACIYYTCITVIFVLFQLLFSGSLTEGYIENFRFFMLFPFSVLISVGCALFREMRAGVGVRYLVHFLFFEAAFFIGIYMPYAVLLRPTAGNTLVIILLANVIYAVLLIINACLHSKKSKKKQSAKKTYTKQFGK